MSKDNKILVEKKVKAAIRGKRYYRQITNSLEKQYGSKLRPNDIQIILFTSEDNEINYYGFYYLDEYLLRKKPKALIILTTKADVYNRMEYNYKKNTIVEIITEEMKNDFIAFYQLLEFDRNLKVVSLEEPAGRGAIKLLSTKKITKELLVAVGIYQLIPFEELPEKYSKERYENYRWIWE